MSTSTYTASGTWVCPSDVTTVQVECWGVGGPGAADDGAGNPGGGGGGGAYAKKNSLTVTPNTSYTIHIGTDNVYFNNTTTVKAASGSAAVGNQGGAAGTSGNSVGDIVASGTAGGGGIGGSNSGGGGFGSTANGGAAGGTSQTIYGAAGDIGGSPSGGGSGGYGAGAAGAAGGGGKVLLTYPVSITPTGGSPVGTSAPLAVPIIVVPLIVGAPQIMVKATLGMKVEFVKNGSLVDTQVAGPTGIAVHYETLVNADQWKARQFDPLGGSGTYSAYTSIQTVGAAPTLQPPTIPATGMLAGDTLMWANGAQSAVVHFYKNTVWYADSVAISDPEGNVSVMVTGGLVAGDTWYATQTKGGTTSAASASVTIAAFSALVAVWFTTIKAIWDSFGISMTGDDTVTIKRYLAGVLDSTVRGSMDFKRYAIVSWQMDYLSTKAQSLLRTIGY